jgi:hypothetical protein
MKDHINELHQLFEKVRSKYIFLEKYYTVILQADMRLFYSSNFLTTTFLEAKEIFCTPLPPEPIPVKQEMKQVEKEMEQAADSAELEESTPVFRIEYDDDDSAAKLERSCVESSASSSCSTPSPGPVLIVSQTQSLKHPHEKPGCMFNISYQAPRPGFSFGQTIPECFDDIITMAELGAFQCPQDAHKVLPNVLRIVRTNGEYLLREKQSSSLVVRRYKQTTAEKMMKEVFVCRLGRKTVTLKDIPTLCGRTPYLVNNYCLFTMQRDELSIFNGYDFPLLPNLSQPLPYLYDTLLYEVICDSNADVYTYLNNWIAFIVQKPGAMTKTAILLKGFSLYRAPSCRFLEMSHHHHIHFHLFRTPGRGEEHVDQCSVYNVETLFREQRYKC